LFVGTFLRAEYCLIVERTVVVEIKATKTIGLAEQRQRLNCLKATDLEVGLLLHFGPNPHLGRLGYSNSRTRTPSFALNGPRVPR